MNKVFKPEDESSYPTMDIVYTEDKDPAWGKKFIKVTQGRESNTTYNSKLYFYNGLNKLIQERQSVNGENTATICTDFEYNILGQKKAVSYPYKVATGNNDVYWSLFLSTTANGCGEAIYYDGLGRDTTKVNLFNNLKTTNKYDGDSIVATDEKGNSTTYCYNARGSLMKVRSNKAGLTLILLFTVMILWNSLRT